MARTGETATAGSATGSSGDLRGWDVWPDTYAHVVSGGSWEPYPWLEWLSDQVSPLLHAGNARIILNAPPRHGKSNFISQWLPVWYLDWYKSKRIILASYGAELSGVFGRWIRNELAGNPAVRLALTEDSSAAHRWNTASGGGMLSVGAGGPISGFGADLIIVDDPVKNWQEAISGTYQTRLRHWFMSTLYTRMEPGASMIVTMTRWDENDLCGFLIDEHDVDWTVLRLPAIAEEGDLMGRKPGQALCPQRYSLEDLEAIRRAVGPAWGPLYQQAPQPSGAGAAYGHFGPWNVDDSVTLDPNLPLCLAVDFNINPGMHCLVGQHIPGADLFVVTDVIHRRRLPILAPDGERCGKVYRARTSLVSDLAQVLQGGDKPQAVHAYGDATGRSGWAGTSESCWDLMAKGLDKLGLWGVARFRVPRTNPPPTDRINAVNDALQDADGHPHVKIHPRCKRLIRDLQRCRLDVTGKDVDKSDTELTHASDALGYWIEYERPVRMARPIDADDRFSVLA